jgi:hypothetical protein
MKKLTNAPVLLLACAFLLTGAKTPFAFCSWSVLALAFSSVALRRRTLTDNSHLLFLASVASILVLQVYSLDPTNSLFWSVQYLVYACLWLALQAMPVDTTPAAFWNAIVCLAAITGALTTLQWFQHAPPYGTLPLNPNFNAVWMAALAAALTAKQRASWREHLLLLWLCILIALGSSRSGLLALVAGMSVSFAHRYSKHKVFLGLAVLVLLAFFIPDQWFLNRLHFFENGARLKMSQLALVSMTDYPLTGYGPGNFEIAYQRHAFPTGEAVRYGHSSAFAHNDYLQAGCELGWPAALFLCGWFFVLIARPIRPDQPLALPAKAILSALGIAAFFNPIFKMPLLGYLAIFSASCLSRTRDVDPRTPPQAMPLAVRWIPVLTLLPVLWCGVRSYWVNRQEWRRILNLNPHDAEAWHNLAYRASDKQESVRDHERAVLESPYQLYYIEALARSLESIPGQEGIYPAIEAYLKAIRLAPTRATNYLGIVRLLWRAGEPREALEWADHARRLEPNYWECDLWKARCFIQLGKKNRAQFILKNVIWRHAQFLQTALSTPSSPYEQAILGYDERIIQEELSRLSPTRSVLKGVE